MLRIISLGAMVAAMSWVAVAGATTDAVIVLRGVDSQSLPPFTLKSAADVSWACSGCAQSNFIFSSAESYANVNALNHTHGTSYLDAGHYTQVEVSASGAWTIVIG